MNKKLNTLFFILGATLFNVLVTVAAFLLLMMIYARFLMHSLPEGSQSWSIPIIFIAAIVISFVVYRYSLNLLVKKIDMDKYFDPIFSSKNRR